MPFCWQVAGAENTGEILAFPGRPEKGQGIMGWKMYFEDWKMYIFPSEIDWFRIDEDEDVLPFEQKWGVNFQWPTGFSWFCGV